MEKEYSIGTLCEEIRLQEEVKAEVLELYRRIDWAACEPFLAGMMGLERPFEHFTALSDTLTEDTRHMKMLTIQLEGARRCLKKYEASGISKDIFLATMSCFTRFVGEFYAKKGVYVFYCPWWAYRQINMSLFRLGELEFEYENSDERGRTINMHIPSDASIGEEKVKESIALCKKFTARYFPAFVGATFACHSWLLSPKLALALPENSRILCFQKLFTVKEVFEEEDQYFGYIFGESPDTPIERLKEETSLQRGVKKLLKQSIGIGAAYGELKKEYS